MELIMRVKTVKAACGSSVSMGMFECPYCNKSVDRPFSSGKKQKSCGCLNRKYNGASKTRIYQVWKDMVNRCYRQKTRNYHRYGGRGISVCKEWVDSFFNFRDWSLQNGYSDDLQIDRKDNDGNYNPLNCRFVVNAVNARNTNSNKLTWVKVDAIRDLRKTGFSLKELSQMFFVRENYISRITRNGAWVYKK